MHFFSLCQEQLSNQSHYDFGLRALKYVLVSAGNIKRSYANEDEQQILIRAICETMLPKLISEDITLMFSLLGDVFPESQYLPRENVK